MTDPTRPVRDQAEQDDALNAAALNAALDERDALRATVARARAVADDPDFHSGIDASPVVFAERLRRALDGATQAAPRPERTPPCTCRQRIEDPRCLHHHPPAAQGVPLTEDPRNEGKR